MEKQETIEILKQKGYDQKDAESMTALFMKNKQYWLEFMMKDELEMPNPENEKPVYNALATFIAFIVLGFIPLIPYFFVFEASKAFELAIIFTLLALTILGVLRWKVTGQGLSRSISESILVGGIAAIIAYIVGIFFRF